MDYVFKRATLFAFLAFCVLVVSVSGRKAEHIGDKVQIALPLLGLGCAFVEGRGLQYFGRYLLLEAAIKTPKFALGDLPINQRPNGDARGFPSGHTAAAAFGATALVQTCLKSSHGAQAAAILAAGFTGASRMDAGKHTIWQVLAGAVLGWAVQVAGFVAFDRWFSGMMHAAVRRGRALLRQGRRLRPKVVAGLASAMVFFGFSAQAETQIFVYSGVQEAPHSIVSGRDPSGIGPFQFTAGWSGKSFAAPPHYGIRATIWRGASFGWWADFNHTKVYATDETLQANGLNVLEFTDGLNVLTAGPMWRFQSPSRKFTPYAGVGLGVALPHVEFDSGGAVTAEYQLGGLAAAWVLGAEFPLTDTWSIMGEYKGTYSDLDVDLNGGGSLESDIITNALNIGVAYRF